MNLLQAIIIAIVEGITEFLPISSTGHMIITEELMGIESTAFTKLFTVAIQLGAILAVVVLYRKLFFDFAKWRFYGKLLVAVLPALAFGALFSDQIDQLLESPLTVSITMLVGGVFLLFVDKLFRQPVVTSEDSLSFAHAFRIGLWQCLAMIPGTSRSAATIIGGMQQKLTRKFAAEFSFYLAVPTMCAATGHKLLKGYQHFTSAHIQLLLAGNLVAFIVAIAAIKLFIGFLQQNGFRLFGWYRIITGIVLLLLIWKGVINA
jgi:undecaprenyl-diphosphatase